MSRENVEIVRAWLDTWVMWFNSGRDPDRLARLASDYMAPDVIYEEDPVWPDAGTYHVWPPWCGASLTTSTLCTSRASRLERPSTQETWSSPRCGSRCSGQVRVRQSSSSGLTPCGSRTVASRTSEPGTTRSRPSKPPGCGSRRHVSLETAWKQRTEAAGSRPRS